MPRKYRSTEIRQKQIVDAARKVIIKYGSEHLTIKRIAKEVGISETAIYRHFKCKKDILSLLADNIEDILVADIAVGTANGSDPLKVLDQVLQSHLSAVERRRGVAFQVIAEIISLGDKKLNKKVAGTVDTYINHLKGFLAEGVKAGQLREDIDLEAAATVLFSIIQGLINIWALNNYSFNPEQRFLPMWQIFQEAIIKNPTKV